MAIRAYSYVRMSSDRQISGDSLRRQEEKSRAYAEAHDLVLDESVRDLGVSAYSGDNVREGALGRFLSLVEAKKISSKSYLLIENFDRLSRENVMDAFALLSRILSAGITVVTLVDNQVYTKDSISKDFGQLIISLASMFRAHEESATKSKRVRAAIKAKRAAAMTGGARYNINLPSWIEFSKGEYSLNEKADAVRIIFELVRDGMTQMAVCRELTRRGIQPFKGARGGWHQSAVAHILSNRAVIGDYVPLEWFANEKVYRQTGDIIPDYFPPVITKELFAQVNEVRRKRPPANGKKGKTFSNLLNGLLVCKECGGPMTMYNGSAKGQYKYLRCYNRLRKERPADFKCDHVGAIRYEDLERTVFVNIGSFRVESDLGSHELMAAEVELMEVTQALEKAEKQLVVFNEAMTNSDDADTIAMLMKQMDAANLRKRQNVSKKELLELSIQQMRLTDSGTQAVDLLSDYMLLDTLTEDDELYRARASINARLRHLLRGIVCYTDEVQVAFLGGEKTFPVTKGRLLSA